VDESFRQSHEYKEFWKKLAAGEIQSGEFKRIGKGGKTVWIQASYNLILNGNGQPYKVIKFATDTTAAKMKTANYEGQLQAIKKAQAVIEFSLEGIVLEANDNFLSTLGYTLDEIKGQHHSMFVDAKYRATSEYQQFWAALRSGEHRIDEFKRIGKGGKEVWIQASYNPIFDPSGKPYKVVKYATDVTASKLRNADFEGQLAAISQSQAVIQFNLDGSIITANDNFLKVLGYRLSDIQGKHHSMLAEAAYASSPEYRQFWALLNAGEYQSGEFMRFGKGGKAVWIQASYNPILDLNGKPYKVVKFATDVTQQVNMRRNLRWFLPR